LEIFVPICEGLAHAHAHGVIHRDLKPGNIVVTENSGEYVPKIVDFGIAKFDTGESEAEALTRTGEIFGTPFYMSPEQCMGETVDQRSDIYSVGCVLFETLTGTPPFPGQTALETMMRHRVDTPPTLKEASLGVAFPEKLEQLVRKTLEKNPDNRYQNCQYLFGALKAVQLNVPELSDALAQQQGVDRRATFIALAVLSAVIICGAVAYETFSGSKQPSLDKNSPTAPRSSPLPEMADASQAGNSYVLSGKRIFNFGEPKGDLGKLMWRDHGRFFDEKAENQVSIPVADSVIFDMHPYAAAEEPEILMTRFHAADLSGVILAQRKGERVPDEMTEG
ncbi:MAG: serine/threonine protein kinase, partial [bacterium]